MKVKFCEILATYQIYYYIMPHINPFDARKSEIMNKIIDDQVKKCSTNKTRMVSSKAFGKSLIALDSHPQLQPHKVKSTLNRNHHLAFSHTGILNHSRNFANNCKKYAILNLFHITETKFCCYWT